MPSSINWNEAQGRRDPTLEKNLKYRIAGALALPPELVRITDCRTRYMGLFLQCSGIADGTPIFAKVFLVDSYPNPARYANPMEELAGRENPEHPVEEQIATERKNLQQMLGLMGLRNIPKPLACSISLRTLVYEAVDGVRVDTFTNDHVSNLLHRRPQELDSVATAICRAGEWLRRLHDSTSQGSETVDCRQLEVALRELLTKRQLANSSEGALASKVLAMAQKEFGVGGVVQVPVAMNHGDFTLANLLWDGSHRQLWVIDFEQMARRPILHDLSAMIFALRKELLHPLASWRVVKRCEDSFWEGYGGVPQELRSLVNALATARLFYFTLPKLRNWRNQRGVWAGLKASVYAHACQPFVVKRLLKTLSDRTRIGIPVADHCEVSG